MMYIEIDDLVGNAFVSYLEKTGKRVLSIYKIEEFGKNIVRDLKSKGTESMLLLSRDMTYSFFYEYADWFVYVERESLVILKDNISVKQLIKKFSGYLSLEVLLAFRNEENIKVLLE